MVCRGPKTEFSETDLTVVSLQDCILLKKKFIAVAMMGGLGTTAVSQ
jgi:hypothetical protein